MKNIFITILLTALVSTIGFASNIERYDFENSQLNIENARSLIQKIDSERAESNGIMDVNRVTVKCQITIGDEVHYNTASGRNSDVAMKRCVRGLARMI